MTLPGIVLVYICRNKEGKRAHIEKETTMATPKTASPAFPIVRERERPGPINPNQWVEATDAANILGIKKGQLNQFVRKNWDKFEGKAFLTYYGGSNFKRLTIVKSVVEEVARERAEAAKNKAPRQRNASTARANGTKQWKAHYTREQYEVMRSVARNWNDPDFIRALAAEHPGLFDGFDLVPAYNGYRQRAKYDGGSSDNGATDSSDQSDGEDATEEATNLDFTSELLENEDDDEGGIFEDEDQGVEDEEDEEYEEDEDEADDETEENDHADTGFIG